MVVSIDRADKRTMLSQRGTDSRQFACVTFVVLSLSFYVRSSLQQGASCYPLSFNSQASAFTYKAIVTRFPSSCDPASVKYAPLVCSVVAY